MDECRHLLDPRGGIGIAAEGHHDDVLLYLGELGNQLVLAEGEVIGLTVVRLAVL